MKNTHDLNIEEEILPLFDYSLNMFAKRKVYEILQHPLKSQAEIMERQNILKGFSANMKVLKSYSYTVLYLNEVHFFLNDSGIEGFSQSSFVPWLLTSRKLKANYVNRFNQMILFFHRLQEYYFSRLVLSEFPEAFAARIRRIQGFLAEFDLRRNEELVRESKIKGRQIRSLARKVEELKVKERISIFWEDLFLFEAYLSINTGILRNGFVFPEFTDKGINLLEFYHPLLKDPVKNKLETSSNVVVVNGPNMSGKSTFLKAVGFCMYVGHLGLGIPAAKATIPFCTDFSIVINRRDDLQKGYSHFMNELKGLKQIIEEAKSGNTCFAVFDELFGGTNVEDALEICKTTISGLSKFENSFFIISTHIEELKNVVDKRISNYYIDCELIDGRPTFTYELKKGWSDIKVGRILFEKEGLNELLN